MSPKVDWSSEAISQAVFKDYKDDGRTLSVYIHGQGNPIKCTSSHRGDYQLAVSTVKDLKDGDAVTYHSRGVNVYSPRDWFYKIDKDTLSNDKGVGNDTSGTSSVDILDLLDRGIKPFKEDERSVRRVFGPPGTGKTTNMMKIIEQRLSEGVKPEEIAFVSFTNVAANEAKHRVADHFPEYTIEDFPFFRTIHSLATVLGGLKGRRLMESPDMLAFDKTIFTKAVWTEKGKAESIKFRDEHPCLSLKSLVSARKSTIEEEIQYIDNMYEPLKLSYRENNWAYSPSTSVIDLAKDWINKYNNYKESKHFVDYDDVIQNMLKPGYNKANMRFKLFIIDEAQDCSDFMWDFLKLVIDESKETVVSGDDDQAIMDEFGSNRMAFLNLETTQEDEVLKTSYRLPTVIFENLMSGGAMDGILNADRPRKEKEFATKKDAKEGFIVRSFKKLFGDKEEEQELDLMHLYIEVRNNKDKDWLIMAPTNKTVESVSKLFSMYKMSHYCKNEPVFTDNSHHINNIRVQTIHTSKGAEAEYVAIAIISKADRGMYYPQGLRYNPSLRYVAESRSKDRMYFVK